MTISIRLEFVACDGTTSSELTYFGLSDFPEDNILQVSILLKEGDSVLYRDVFENQILAYIHLSANIELLRLRLLKVFSLSFEPVFFISYRGEEIRLNRAGRVRSYDLSCVLGELDEALSIIRDRIDIRPLNQSSLRKAVEKMKADLSGVGYT